MCYALIVVILQSHQNAQEVQYCFLDYPVFRFEGLLGCSNHTPGPLSVTWNLEPWSTVLTKHQEMAPTFFFLSEDLLLLYNESTETPHSRVGDAQQS